MKYTEKGKLEDGLHSMTAHEFIDAFCKEGNRAGYEHAVTIIFDYAMTNAPRWSYGVAENYNDNDKGLV